MKRKEEIEYVRKNINFNHNAQNMNGKSSPEQDKVIKITYTPQNESKTHNIFNFSNFTNITNADNHKLPYSPINREKSEKSPTPNHSFNSFLKRSPYQRSRSPISRYTPKN